jgi:hypothetical protein
MIYICSPYTHSDPNVVQERVDLVTVFVNQCLLKATTVISPVVYGHSIVMTCGMPSVWTFWEKVCCDIMDKCTEVWVLKIDGWDQSTGIKGEIEYAHNLGLPVKYIEVPNTVYN